MATYKTVDADVLDAKFQAIADAIRSKNGETELYDEDDMPAKIEAIKSYNEIPGDNAATASDIVEGKQADVNGELITGTLPEVTSQQYFYKESVSVVMDEMEITAAAESDMVLRKDTPMTMIIDTSEFGDARIFDVRAGKTFTAENGFKQTGTMQVSNFATGNTSVSSGKIIFSLSFTPKVVSIFCTASVGGGAYSVNDSKGGYYISTTGGTLTYANNNGTITLTMSNSSGVNGMPIKWYAA